MLIFFCAQRVVFAELFVILQSENSIFLIIWEEHLNFAKPENLSVGATWHAPSRASVKR